MRGILEFGLIIIYGTCVCSQQAGFVTSPGYPSSYTSDPIEIEVHADGQYIVFLLDDIDIRAINANNDLDVNERSEFCIDSLVITEPDSPNTQLINICGNIEQFPPSKRYFSTLWGNTATVTLRRNRINERARGSGFKLLYVSGFLECFDVQYSLQNEGEGLLSSHIFPSKPCPSVTYTFKLQQQSEIFLTFLLYSSEVSCSEGYLEIDQSSVFCGSGSNHVIISRRYFQTFTIFAQTTRFLAKFETKPSRDRYLEKVVADFSSRNYPQTNFNSTWSFTTNQRTSAFIILDVKKPFDARPEQCTYQGLYVYDGPKLLHFTCPGINARQSIGQKLISSTNNISIILVNGTGQSKVEFSVKYGYYIEQELAGNQIPPPNPIVHTIDAPTTTQKVDPSTSEQGSGITPPLMPDKQAPLSKPEILDVKPTKGIIAGGSTLTVSGRNFTGGLMLLLGGYQAIPIGSCSRTQCLFLTPGVDSSIVDEPLEVRARFSFSDTITLPFQFVYKPNPLLTEVYPLNILAVGGTTVTVKGSGFDAVSDPKMIITMTHTVNGTDGKENTQTGTNFTSPCNKTTDSTLKCQTPTIDVPDQFLIAESPKRNRTRRKRDSFSRHGADFYTEIENEALDFHLGFQLDGDTKYANLTESLPDYADLRIFVGVPTFTPFDDVMIVRGGEHLQIKGYNLTNGLTMDDYSIVFDETTCEVSDLNLNSLFCLTPHRHGELLSRKMHRVRVFPGSKLGAHFIGEVKYEPTENSFGQYVIIGCVVVAALTLLSLFVEAVCSYSGRKK